MRPSILCGILLFLHVHVLVVPAYGITEYSNVNDTSLILSNSIVLLGVILPIHPPNVAGDANCGRVSGSNLQRAEAIAFAVSKINSDPTLLLPAGTKLGFVVRDSCLMVNKALDLTLDFITGSTPVGNTSYRASGIIGETQSTISINMASLLRLFRIPQVSPYSTASGLSDKTLYEYFLRTPPPDNYQSAALVDLVEFFNWSYIITINSGDTYGRDGINQFNKILSSRNGTRCIAANMEIPFPTPTQSDFDKAAARFVEPMVVNASAVVLFGHTSIAKGLLDALMRQNITRRLFWVGSDSWGVGLDGIYPMLLGNQISVVPKTNPSVEFDRYFKSLHISNHTSNPWFAEYWQNTFNCSLSNVTGDPRKLCDTANQQISSAAGYVQESFIPLTIDAVMAFAYAIRDLQKSACNGSGLLCSGILDSQSRNYIPGELLKPYLFNATFPSQSGGNFSFDMNGDPSRVSYTINNLQLQNGSYSYVPVGTWSNANPSSPLNFTQSVVWNNKQGSTLSQCSDPCQAGQYRLYSSKCCWRCVDCSGGKDYSDGTICGTCEESFAPNQFRNGCTPIQPTYYHSAIPAAIVILTITCIGIVTTICVIVIFIVHFTNKIIKAAGRELTSFLFAGILLSYIVPFLFVIKPSAVICGIRWVGVGLGFAISFSALLIRTIRIHRIFNRPMSTKPPLFVGSISQSVFTLILVGVQVVIMVVWLAVERPGVKYVYGTATGEVLCSQSPYSSFTVIVGYNCLLLIATTYYAFRTRNVPKNFNETKFINLTVYSLVIIWVVLLPTYFGTAGLGNLYWTTSLLLTIVLSASVVLGATLISRLVYLFRNLYGDLKSTETTVPAGEVHGMGDLRKSEHFASKGRVSHALENGFHDQEKMLCDSSTQTETEQKDPH